ncbi:class D beta-lactamase [Chryseobacterium lactis]|uniref:beta-lactamase n=1 Tax=Chryseobacterium lactis TaxID=1241981 RepID=A0A3G6RIH8_CHRLC|nr:class D beta-lactamase [Chryseobacterium lactis]AZA84393.1 class D beta-lactamase [Chryseobacterium lactis]AZB04781.1 class D beta-lactamase [Chryseobacterium lactis]PNW14512.1 class D beta-lactamase [Chryseobacterium lactis]
MKFININFLFTVVAFFLIVSFTSDSTEVIRNDFKKFYDKYGVEGSFIMYDQADDRYTIYNKEQISTPFTPASTFKICNSLISLETGVIKDENIVFKWDGKERPLDVWNKDTDMRDAFKNSTVWYYQELARRVGENRMKSWLKKSHYGNEDISGGIDAFWLSGGLRITPGEQIDFLRRLHDDKLPFSKRSMDIVKDIMIVSDTSGTVIRAKPGAGKQGQQYVGWYVGYITTKDNVYYFSNCIQSIEKKPDFGKARFEILNDILDELKVLKKL